MHIKDISVRSIRNSMDGKRINGDVEFLVGGKGGVPSKHVNVTCDLPYTSKIRPDALLIGDAIRQLRHMPRVRTGEDRLTFEPGLRPLSQPASQAMDRPSRTG